MVLRYLLVSALFFIMPVLRGQNWMMAKNYATIFADTVVAQSLENSDDILFYDYAGFRYDPLNEEYTIFMIDTTLTPVDKSDDLTSGLLDSADYYATIKVSLHGGTAYFDDNLFTAYEADLPDFSQEVYIWNNTGMDMSFSLSCDDSNFYSYALVKDEFNHYGCGSSPYVYIKIITLKEGVESGQVHYKLENGKGYKVQYDPSGGKFEVYTDNRL